jgi:hypothetical protein
MNHTYARQDNTPDDPDTSDEELTHEELGDAPNEDMSTDEYY